MAGARVIVVGGSRTDWSTCWRLWAPTRPPSGTSPGDGRGAAGHDLPLVDGARPGRPRHSRRGFGTRRDHRTWSLNGLASGERMYFDLGVRSAAVDGRYREAEIAFSLGANLVDGPLDREQVEPAVEAAAPALEIVDSRVDRSGMAEGRSGRRGVDQGAGAVRPPRGQASGTLRAWSRRRRARVPQSACGPAPVRMPDGSRCSDDGVECR